MSTRDRSGRSRAARRSSGAAAYLLSVLVLAFGAVAVAYVLSGQLPGALSDLDPAPVPVTAPVEESSISFSSPASVVGAFDVPPELIAPGRAGTVTSVDIDPGAALEQGSTIYTVDALPVRAYSSPTVFYRPLSGGSRGPDVRAAQELLAALLPDRAVTADGTFGPEMTSAVKAYEASIGVAKPEGVFDPTWFVRLPAAPYTVASTSLVLGTAAPGLGAAIAAAQPTLTGLEVLLGETNNGPDGAYTFTSEGRQLTVNRAGDRWTISDLTAAAAVLTGELSPDGRVRKDGQLRLTSPVPGHSVPPTALIGGDGNRTCIVTVTGSARVVVEVTVIESTTAGAAVIEPTLTLPLDVLVNPGQVAPDTPCPSP